MAWGATQGPFFRDKVVFLHRMVHDFLGMHVREKRFVFWDDGEGFFSCTTEENTAAGLIQALKMPNETKNTNVY